MNVPQTSVKALYRFIILRSKKGGQPRVLWFCFVLSTNSVAEHSWNLTPENKITVASRLHNLDIRGLKGYKSQLVKLV